MNRHRTIGKKDNQLTKRNFLVTIAINEYKHFVHLNNAIKDVEEITDVLIQLYQFDKQEIFKLHNEEATEKNIYELFRMLVKEVNEQDNLAIFYSGHGYFDPEFDEGYWIPVDGQEDDISDYISNGNIINALRKVKAHHLLLVIDSCFSGSLVSRLRSSQTSEQYPSRRVFASGRQEVVEDGMPGENSPFAKGIINFLRYNSEKYVNTTSLIEHVKRFVENNSKQTPVDGRIPNSKDDGGEFIFHRRLSEEELWVKALEKNTLDSYQEYLDVFPEGQYTDTAFQNIEKIKEEEAWKKAVSNGTPNDFKNFIKNFPLSAHFEDAEIKLLESEEAIKLQQRRAAELAKQGEEELKLREKFRSLTHEGDALFMAGNYAFAQTKYWHSLEFYIQGFVPDREYIDKKIKECNDNQLFVEYKTDGIRAFNNKNWELAVQNLALAQKYYIQINGKDDEQIAKLLSAASQLPFIQKSVSVRPGKKRALHPPKIQVNPQTKEIKKTTVASKIQNKTAGPITIHPPKGKKRNYNGLVVGIIVFAIIVFLFLLLIH